MVNDEEDLGSFINEQKAKIAHEREILRQNPPSAVTDNTFNREVLRRGKENRIPVQELDYPQHGLPLQKTTRPPSTPRIFRLGEDYKNKKEQLKEELRNDYRNAMAQQGGVRLGRRSTNFNKPDNSEINNDLGLSLPIKDRLSAKERQRLQRNKEYNMFLKQKKKQIRKQRIQKGLKVTPQMTPDSTETTVFDRPINPNAPPAESYDEILQRKRRQESHYRSHEDFENGELSGRDYTKPHVNAKHKKNRRSQLNDSSDSDKFDDVIDEEIFRMKVRKALSRRKHQKKRNFDLSSDDDDLSDDLGERRTTQFVKVPKIKKSLAPQKQVTVAPTFEKSRSSLDPVSRLKTNKESDTRSKSAPPDEFTGLPIGHVTSANTLRKQKEEYRLNLLQQMEDNNTSKRRERQIDLELDAKLIGGSTTLPWNSKKDTQPQGIDDDKLPEPQKSSRKKQQRDKSVSYKLDLSNSDDDEPDYQSKRKNARLPRQANYFMGPPVPTLGFYQPHMMANPYADPYTYYGAQDPLSGPAPPPAVPAGGYYPGVAPGVSPLLAAANQHLPSQESKQHGMSNTATISPHKPRNQESSLVPDDKREETKKREMMKQYQEELKVQMDLKNQRRQQEKEEQERYELKMEEEARNYNPYGKGGGDLRQMHLENEEMVRDPTKAAAVVSEKIKTHREERPVINLSPRREAQAPGESTEPHGFGRHNPFEVKESNEQKTQKDLYKEILKKQIEEKNRIESERREKLRLEEEKEERRLEAERQKLADDYHNELKKDEEKREKIRKENEEMRKQQEKNAQEELRKRQEEREERENEIRKQKEAELEKRLRRTTDSPPIPTLQTKANEPTTSQQQQPAHLAQTNTQIVQQNTQPQPAVPVTVVSEQHQPVQKSFNQPLRGQSPIVMQSGRPQLQSQGETKRISRELSALRKQLLSEQRRVENQLKQSDAQKLFLRNNQDNSNNRQPEYVVDLSRSKQRPVQVRRPPSVELNRPNSQALREFKDYKYRTDDTASLRMFKAEYPESPDNADDLEAQQNAYLRKQARNLQYYRSGSETQPNYSEAPAGTSLRPAVAQSRASLLEAETAYIPLPIEEQSLPPSRQQSRPSARERRRMKHRGDSIASEAISGPSSRQPDQYSLGSLATIDVERLAQKNETRLNRLKQVGGDEISLSDPDDILNRFVNNQRNPRDLDTPLSEQGYHTRGMNNFNTRPPTVNTVESEPWLRPETEPPVVT